MICKKCKKEIADDAVACAHCGAKATAKKSILKKWWFWVILVVLIAIISSAGNGNESSVGDDQKPVTTTSQEQATISYETVNLEDMFSELQENAMKAEEKYKKKNVELTAKIKIFDSDGSYITVEPVTADEWNFESAMCYIKTQEQKEYLMEKSVGDTITVRGQIKSVGEVLGYSLDIEEVE